MGEVPAFVSIVFIITTFAAVAFLLQGLKIAGLESSAARTFLFVLPLWIIFQCVLSMGGFYRDAGSFPPRLIVFGVAPALVFTIFSVAAFRGTLIRRLPLGLLTLIHIVRIPIELVLYWLFLGELVPREMTFAGWNPDIITGVLALAAYLAVFTFGIGGNRVLAVFNAVGLLLLVNAVSIGAMSAETPFQQLAFGQPNRAVTMFPYALLATVVVPIILFSHIASLVKICQRSDTHAEDLLKSSRRQAG